MVAGGGGDLGKFVVGAFEAGDEAAPGEVDAADAFFACQDDGAAAAFGDDGADEAGGFGFRDEKFFDDFKK